jgi:hypothetical protein
VYLYILCFVLSILCYCIVSFMNIFLICFVCASVRTTATAVNNNNNNNNPWEPGFFPGAKAFGRRGRGGGKIGHSELSSVAIRNGRSDTSNPLTYFQDTDRANFLKFVFFHTSYLSNLCVARGYQDKYLLLYTTSTTWLL